MLSHIGILVMNLLHRQYTGRHGTLSDGFFASSEQQMHLFNAHTHTHIHTYIYIYRYIVYIYIYIYVFTYFSTQVECDKVSIFSGV